MSVYNAITAWWSGPPVTPVTQAPQPQMPRQDIEEGWERVEDNRFVIVEELSMREIVPYAVPINRNYTVEFPDELALVPVNRVNYCFTTAIVEMEESSEQAGPLVIDLDTPQEAASRELGLAAMKATIVTTALGMGGGVYAAEVGGTLLLHTVSAIVYRRMVSQSAWPITQYVVAHFATRETARVLGMTFFGWSMPFIANAIAAGVTILVVAEIGTVIYNRCVDKPNRLAHGELASSAAQRAIQYKKD